eukprot:3966586-Amphidinium_carterae.1
MKWIETLRAHAEFSVHRFKQGLMMSGTEFLVRLASGPCSLFNLKIRTLHEDRPHVSFENYCQIFLGSLIVETVGGH